MTSTECLDFIPLDSAEAEADFEKSKIMSKDYVYILSRYTQSLGPRSPVYSVRFTQLHPQPSFTCHLTLPFDSEIPIDVEVKQPSRKLAMGVAACLACTLLLQRGKLDSSLKPLNKSSVSPNIVLGNTIITSNKQRMLGLEFIDLMSLRRALTFQPVLDSSSSWAALGEAFLKFFYAAYFFSRYQNDTEGALTTRIDNESRNNVICTYLESSGLAVNACYHKAGHVEDTAATIFRRVIGAAISLDGADAALRTTVTLGMKTDFPVYTIKDIEAVYRQCHPVNNRPSAQVLGTLDDNILARIQTVQEALGYEFRDPQLLVKAITHKSATVSTMEIESYERLEFLGDAVVEFCIAEHYYRRYPNTELKNFRQFRSFIASNDSLGSLLSHLGLHKVIIRNRESTDNWAQYSATDVDRIGISRKGLSGLHINKVLGDVMESLVAAVFVDAGFSLESVMRVLERTLFPFIDNSNIKCHIGKGFAGGSGDSSNKRKKGQGPSGKKKKSKIS